MVTTKNYGLTAFGTGDTYSGSADQDRFVRIDNQLAFLSDLIEDGKISGWLIYDDSTSSEIRIAATTGVGLIDRFITRTFNDISLKIDDNKKYYIYMQRKTNFIGGLSGFSDYAELVFADTSAPSIPSNLLTVSIDFDKIDITWDQNTDVDLSHYIIQRSTDNINFNNIATSIVNFYQDSSLTENTLYYYKIIAVDKSDNQSLPTPSQMSKTLKDLRIALDARFLMSFTGDSLVQLCWQKSLWSNVAGYEIIVYELDPEFSVVAEVYSNIVDEMTNSIIVRNLTNDIKYKFVLYAINSNGIRSSGLDVVDTPRCNNGPLEVEDLLLSYVHSSKNTNGITIDASWIPQIDPYDIRHLSVKYIITVIENGQIISDVKNIYNATSTHFEIYNKDSLGRQVLPKTSYIIKVQAANQYGDINNGTVGILQVGKFTNPSDVTNLNAVLNNFPSENNNILFTWDSSDDYQSDYITIKRKDILTNVETILVSGMNIGKARTYLLESQYIVKNNKYTFSIYKMDEFGNISETSSVSINVISNDIPDIATNQIAYNGNNSALLTWAKMDEASSYKIWRANYDQNSVIAADFILIDIVDGDKTTYTDYSVSNGHKYYYFITTVGRNGKESLNPINDDFASYPLLYASPRGDVFLQSPQGLTAVNSGLPNDFDVVLTWTGATDDFDGYDIFRSFSDKNSWVHIAYVAKGTTTFIDKDVLLETGNYYYMIRKFRNEAVLFASTSSIPPTDSILMAIVDVNFGLITIDNSVVNNISNWHDPINKYITNRMNIHKHDIKLSSTGNIIDKRIDLEENVIIDDWTTPDTQVYTTTSSISDASSLIVRLTKENTIISDWETEDTQTYTTFSSIPDSSSLIVKIDYEVTSIGYTLDKENGTITFNTPTDSLNLSVEFVGTGLDNSISSINYSLDKDNKKIIFENYTDAFNISVEFVGVNEIKNSLLEEQFVNINANFIESDLLKKYQIDKIDHKGRTRDVLVPLQITMETSDNYKYIILQNSLSDYHEDLGNSLTFYDIIKFQISSDFCLDEIFKDDTCDISPYTGLVNMMLAATSKGLMASIDEGKNWHNILVSDVPFKRVFYSDATNRFIAIAHNSVYVSNNGMNWVKTKGIEYITVVRDITDDLSNVYISTDLGVYYLSQDKVGQFTQWIQTRLMSAVTSDCYALLYDSNSDKVIVSTEIGLFETKNQGLTWSYTDILKEQVIIYKFIISGNYIFALGDNYIYRSDSLSEFINIGYINSDISRNVVIYNDRLMISTNSGICFNNESFDIYSADNIELVFGFSRINFSDKIIPVTSLNIIDSNIWIGTDQRLFYGSSLDDVRIQYENVTGITPTIYINDKEQRIGFQYDYVNKIVVFDKMLSDDDKVTVANQYQLFKSEKNGWVNTKYDSPVNVYKDNALLFSISGSVIPTQQFGTVTFETFTEFNSNSSTANLYAQDYLDEFSRLTNILNGNSSLNPGEQLTDIIYNLTQLYYKCYSQLNGDVRFTSSITYNSKQFVVFNFEKVLYDIYPKVLEQYEIVPDIPDVLIFDGIAIDSSNITINIVNGQITFKSSFDKYNTIYINVENTTLKNSGTKSHDIIENAVEDVNTGLTTGLTDVQSANIVNTGIFIRDHWDSEQQNDEDVCNLIKVYPPLNAKYFLPGEKDWYDILNSTIDYQKMIDYKNTGLFVNYITSAIYINNNDPYSDISFVLIGHDNGLIKINVEDVSDISDGNTFLKMYKINFNHIDGNEFVKDIQFIDDIIYVLTENYLYYSNDFGLTWIKDISLGLNQKKLIKFNIINKNKVIAANDGIYCMLNLTDRWIKTFSNSKLSLLFRDNLLFAITDNQLFYSRDGVVWSDGGDFKTVRISNLNKYRANILLATNQGLRSDISTFYSGNLATSLINLKGDPVSSSNINVNDVIVHSNGTRYIAVDSEGSYYISDFDSITEYTDSGLDTIHKIIFVGDDFWMFGFDMLKISSVSNPIKISTGIRI